MQLQPKSSLLPCALTLLLLVSASQTAPVWAQSARDREEKAQPKTSSSSSSKSERDSSSSSSSSSKSNDQPARDREERSQSRSRRDDRDRDGRVIIYNDPYYGYGDYGYGRGGNNTYFRGRRFAPRIAFVSDRDGYPDLYMMWENGAYLERLTRTPGIEMQPEFSPRKGRLAFIQDTGQIVVMNADGAKRMEINVKSHAPARDLVWLPDDKRIAFVSEREGNAEIYTIEPTGRNLQRLTNHPASDTQPIFSPGGGNMVFVSTRDGKPALYAMRTDGTGEVRRISPMDLPPISDPAYAPDGNSVVFVAGEGTTTDLFLMDMTSGVVRKIVVNMGKIRTPVFSPEGNRIAFSSNKPGYFALFTISPFSNSATSIPDPKDVVQITFGPWNDTEPTWW